MNFIEDNLFLSSHLKPSPRSFVAREEKKGFFDRFPKPSPEIIPLLVSIVGMASFNKGLQAVDYRTFLSSVGANVVTFTIGSLLLLAAGDKKDEFDRIIAMTFIGGAAESIGLLTQALISPDRYASVPTVEGALVNFGVTAAVAALGLAAYKKRFGAH